MKKKIFPSSLDKNSTFKKGKINVDCHKPNRWVNSLLFTKVLAQII